MDESQLPNELEACHQVIANLQSQVEQQAHSVLELKNHNDKLEEKNSELTLRVEKLLQQLFGRKSERRTDGEGQLFLDLGEEATPEVVIALEEAVREADQIVQDAEQEKRNRRVKRPRPDDRKFPEHLPRTEKTVDLPEEQREGLTLIGYDEVESLHCKRSELYVQVTRYAKYAHPNDKTQGIVSPERPTGLVEGNRFDVSIGVEVVAWKYFYHLPLYRQQDLFAGSGWTPSRSTLQNLETNVEFALRPLADWLRGYLKADSCIGCDETGVVLITPRNLPDLSDHPRQARITEVLEAAIQKGKPSVKAHFWGY